MRTTIAVFSIFIGLLVVSCNKEKKEKNTATITYNCVMNGYGKGHCTFTNAESAGTGAKCGKIKVVRPLAGKYVESEIFCSGKVEPSSSKQVEFTIPAVNQLCDTDNGQGWNTVCEFGFLPKE